MLSDKIKSEDFKLIDENNQHIEKLHNKYQINYDSRPALAFTLETKRSTKAKFVLEIQSSLKEPLISFSLESLTLSSGRFSLKIPLQQITLNSGNYSIAIGLIDENSQQILFRIENICPFCVKTEVVLWGKFLARSSIEITKA